MIGGLRYLSVCSGIEAATVAWHPLGWTPWAFSEIDKFPSAVLAHHYPDVPNLGDMIRFREWPDAAIDLLVGGTPCQSFSVAGLRKGLDDPRGSLLLTYLAIARRYRPRWLVWENVPGVLSSDNGRAFGSLLGGLAELGYGFAYSVRDAQYFGLAQRRARVFVVGHLGDWRRAAAVLFERESLSGHPAPRREAGAVATQSLTGRLGGGGADDNKAQGHFYVGERERALTACHTATGRLDPNEMEFVAHSLRADGFDASEDGTGRGTPLVPIYFQDDISIKHGEVVGALRRDAGGQGACVAHAFDARQSDVLQYGDQAGPLDTDGHSIAVMAFSAQDHGNDAGAISPTLRKGGDGGGVQPAVMQGMAVRRLTPRECERLQGFPDNYTLIPYRGKPAADGPRYKAIGNSMAVPVMAWIGRRIALVDAIGTEDGTALLERDGEGR